MIKWIYAEPIDTLFFRDGKPFERGTENTAFSIFPPSPRTFYGALRTLIIMANSDLADYDKDTSLTTVVGNYPSLGNLKLLGPFLAEKTSTEYYLLFPIPKDLLYDKESGKVIKINPIELTSGFQSNIQFDSSIKLSLPERSDDGNFLKGGEIEGFLSSDRFLSYYLFDQYQELSASFEKIEDNSYFCTENKVGIKLDKATNTSELHYLFSLPHKRLDKDIGFVFGVLDDSGKMPDNGKFRLGGETRLVRFETVNNLQDIISKFNEGSKQILKNKNQIKFVLFTPAIFEKGWAPDFLDEKLEGTLGNVKLRLISCLLGKSEYIGGFDLAKGYPKEMKKAVPEGSVYFFEVLENQHNNLNDLIEKYNFNSIETDNDLLKQGFGQIIIGGW